MGSLADIARGTGRANSAAPRVAADIITFIESAWGLNFKLFPVQRVILKAYYGLELDDNAEGFPLDAPVPTTHPNYRADLMDVSGFYSKRIEISNWRRDKYEFLTEAGYLRKLYDEGRCNIREVVAGQERQEMILSIGRRSGKTTISACISAYETYRLITKGDPQAYYGLPAQNTIQLISVATDKDQAGLLYQEVSGHFRNCAIFNQYTANNTMSYARFQTPKDIERYGSYHSDPTAKASIKVTFRSCVAKGLRGAGNIVIILDEVAHFTDDGQSSADSVYQAVVPSSAAYSPKDPNNKLKPIGDVEAKIILISSPLGRQGMFYKSYETGFRGGKVGDRYLCVQAPTWEVNPTVEGGFLEGEFIKDARKFFTEFGAEFTDRTRGWLEDRADLIACVNPALRPRTRAAPRQPHFAGFDLGLVNDASALAIGHLEDGHIVLDVLDSIQAGVGQFAGDARLEFSEVVDWIYDYSRRFFITECSFDMSSGIVLEQTLAKKGLKSFTALHHTPELNSRMFQNFKDMMFDKRLELYNWPIPPGETDCDYIRELMSLQAEMKSKNIITVEAPRVAGKHDDLSDALVRMVWAASQNMGKMLTLSGMDRRPHLTTGGRPTTQNAIASRKRALLSGSHPDRQVPKPDGRGGRGGNSFGGGRGGFGSSWGRGR